MMQKGTIEAIILAANLLGLNEYPPQPPKETLWTYECWQDKEKVWASAEHGYYEIILAKKRGENKYAKKTTFKRIGLKKTDLYIEEQLKKIICSVESSPAQANSQPQSQQNWDLNYTYNNKYIWGWARRGDYETIVAKKIGEWEFNAKTMYQKITRKTPITYVVNRLVTDICKIEKGKIQI